MEMDYLEIRRLVLRSFADSRVEVPPVYFFHPAEDCEPPTALGLPMNG